MNPMKNEVTELCKIDYPIFLGGMYPVSTPALVAAVSNAGGCGILSSLTYKDPTLFSQAIDETRSLIKDNKPFGVNITFITNKTYTKANITNLNMSIGDYNRQICDIIINKKIPIVETASTNDENDIKSIVSYFANYDNITIIHKSHSVKNALIAQQCGAHIASMDGFESAGHYGFSEISNSVLVPMAVKVLSIPVIASGGIVNGQQMASMLCLGAQGVKLGTRFMATVEAPCHVNCKLAIIGSEAYSGKDSTVSVFKKNGSEIVPSTIRVYDNKAARMSVSIKGSDVNGNGNGSEDGKDGDFNKLSFEKAIIDGKTDDYVWACGQGACLIDDMPSCKEVIDRMVKECRQAFVINSKL